MSNPDQRHPGSDPSGSDNTPPPKPFPEYHHNEREHSAPLEHSSLAITPLLTPQRARRNEYQEEQENQQLQCSLGSGAGDSLSQSPDGSTGSKDASHPVGSTEERFSRNLRRKDTDEITPNTATRSGESPVPTDLDISMEDKPYQECSTPITSQRRSEPQCDICFAKSLPKKPVKEASEDDVNAGSTVELEYNGLMIRPFDHAKQVRTNEALAHGGTNSDVKVYSCSECIKDFRRIHRLKVMQLDVGRSSKDRDRKEIEVRRYLQKFCKRRTRNQLAATKITVASRQCILKHKNGTPCSEGQAGMRRPSGLAEISDIARDSWIQKFAAKTKISVEDAKEIVSRCYEISLCSVHGSTYRNVLQHAILSQRRCSVCGSAGKGRCTAFDWTKLRTNEETKCVVEDAIAACFDNSLSPYDIQQVCDECRRQILRDIDVRENAPREVDVSTARKAAYRRSKKGLSFAHNHGPTKISIRMLINWIREELTGKETNVVLMRDIRSKYDELVVKNGEQKFAFHHDKTIRKYIQPSLALTEIYPDVGSNKVGTFFSCRSTLRRLAAEGKAPPKSVDISIDEEYELAHQFQKYILEHQAEITESRWKLADFIRAVPHKLWYRRLRGLRSQPHMLRRCKARAKLLNKNYFMEWPCNPQECPTDMQTLPEYEFSYITSVYFSIERDIFGDSSRRARGPLLTALSIAALTSTNISYMSLLNRMSCAASYQLIDRMRQNVIVNRERDGPFETLVPRRFVVCGVDNLNKRSGHSIAVHGGTYHGYDGLALQASNPNTSFDATAFCAVKPSDNDPKPHQDVPDKMEFVKKLPSVDDADLTAYRWLSVGLAVANKDNIATDDPKKQRSFRRVVMDGLEGFSKGKAKVEFVSVTQCNPNSSYELNKVLNSIRQKYNPPGCREVTLVAVVGDQPIFKHFFTIWLESYVKKTRLCRWMIPLPGGFHIDKQGLIPLIKAFMEGSGFEELLKFSGLSKRHQEIFMKLAHFRKCRRFLSQLTAAEILRLVEALGELDPTFAERVASVLKEIREEESLPASERDKLLKNPTRAAELRSVLPGGSALAISSKVSPAVIRLGRMICEKTKEVSRNSVNMRFFGEAQLLHLLVPWTGYNILTRKGQTRILDKFWFFCVGLMHGTNKIRYQENLLFYALVKETMPANASELLYTLGHSVYNSSETDTETNGHHDEGIESGIVKEVKALPSNNPKDISKAPLWAKMITDAMRNLENELCPSARRRTVNADVDDPTAEKKKYDREKRTAVNVLHMLRFLNEKKWLGRAHTYSEFIVNPLREDPLIVDDPCFAEKIIQAEAIGRTTAMMHLASKIGDIFGPIEENDHGFFPAGTSVKQIPKPGTWTTKYAFKSMAKYDRSRKIIRIGSKRSRAGMEDAEKEMLRLTKTLNNARDDLLEILSKDTSETRRSGAQRMLAELADREHILSDRAYAYRQNLHSDNAYYRLEGIFIELQEVLCRKDLIDRTMLFASCRYYEGTAQFLSVHIDLTDEIRFAPMSGLETLTVGDAVFSRLQTAIQTYMPTKNLHSLREVHIHMDVESETPPQFLFGYQKKRSSARHVHRQLQHGEKQSLDNDMNSRNDVGMTGSNTPVKSKADVDTELRDSWASIICEDGNMEFLRSLYAVLGARSALERVESSQNACSSSSAQGACSSNFRVYIHGASIAITTQARRTPMNKLSFKRFGDGLLAYASEYDDIEHRLSLAREDTFDAAIQVDGYGSDCCWEVSSGGMRRFPDGDSFHGLSTTRIVFALKAITKNNFGNWRIPESAQSVWVASPHHEAALLTLGCRSLEAMDIVSVLDDRSTFVSSKRLSLALERNGISIEDLMLAHAMSGCAVCPSTQGIPKKKYLEALIENRGVFESLNEPGMLLKESPSISQAFTNLETFVATTYLLVHGNKQGFPKKASDVLSLQSRLGSEWPQAVRKCVARSTNVLKPMLLMPEKDDIQLQAKRSLWALRYWMEAEQRTCTGSSAGCLSVLDGYKDSGEPLLETEESINQRQKKMKKPVQTCACQTGCLKRCGCTKRSIPCLLCDCSELCQNRGAHGAPVIPRVGTDVISEEEPAPEELAPEDGAGDYIDYELHSSDEDDGRYDSDADSIDEEGKESIHEAVIR